MRLEKPYQNVGYFFTALLFVCLLGFYQSYFSLFPGFTGTTLVVHFHVLTLLLWFALLIVQPVLIRKKRLALHRKLGRLSYGLVVLILIGFILILNQGQLRHKEPGLVGATLFDAGLFFLFYGLGIYYRKNPAYHARFMILSALPFINPSIGRLISPGVSIAIELLAIISLLLIERFNNRTYRPYWIGLGSFFIGLGFIIYISVVNPAVIESMWRMFWE